jgi:hypothetical protein
VDGVEGANDVPWSHFRNFLRTDEFLFLIVDQRHFSVIPIDAFDSPADANAFESILIEKLKRLPRRYF